MVYPFLNKCVLFGSFGSSGTPYETFYAKESINMDTTFKFYKLLDNNERKEVILRKSNATTRLAAVFKVCIYFSVQVSFYSNNILGFISLFQLSKQRWSN